MAVIFVRLCEDSAEVRGNRALGYFSWRRLGLLRACARNRFLSCFFDILELLAQVLRAVKSTLLLKMEGHAMKSTIKVRRCDCVVICIALLVIHCSGCSSKEPNQLRIPKSSEIANVKATLIRSPEERPDVPEFVLPTSKADDILKYFSPNKLLKDAPPSCKDYLGKIMITCRNGEKVTLRFFWTGKNPVIFSPDRVHFYQGTSPPSKDAGLTIDHILREAYINRPG